MNLIRHENIKNKQMSIKATILIYKQLKLFCKFI